MAKEKKEKKPKKGFMDGYKTYNPDEEGFGNPDQWKNAFNYRMGFDAAKEVLGERDPCTILGIAKNCPWEEVKRAHRKLAMQYHPDRNIGDAQAETKFKEVQAAYEILMNQYGK